jgi:hypothetical protein
VTGFDCGAGGATTADPRGGGRAGIEASGEIDRCDFDFNWDVKTRAGVPLASHHVKILVDLGAVRAGLRGHG